MEIAIGDCIICIVELCVVVTKYVEVYVKWFVLHGSASMKLPKDVLSDDKDPVVSRLVSTVFQISRGFLIPLMMRRTSGEDESLIIDAASASLAFQSS